MKHKVTSSWLNSFSQQYRQASYQDKLQHILKQKNAYYLLEWLFVPVSESISEQLQTVRTPGLIKKSMDTFDTVFFQQLLFDVCFSDWAARDYKDALLATAVKDLKMYYGIEQWDASVSAWRESIRTSLDRFDQFQLDLQKEHNLLLHRLHEQWNEIDSLYIDDEELRQTKRQSVKQSYEQKLAQAHKPLLQQKYDPWPLVSYLHYRGWNHSRQTVDAFIQSLTDTESLMHDAYVNMEAHDFYEQWTGWDRQERKQFVDWYISYASKSDLTRGFIDTKNRQQWWLRLLSLVSERMSITMAAKVSADFDSSTQQLLQASFEITGIEDELLSPRVPLAASNEDRVVPDYFWLLVLAALKMGEQQTKWLRDKVILRQWSVFYVHFASSRYSFNDYAWVLCLDPASLEERLLRSKKKAIQPKEDADRPMQQLNMDPAFIVERCCELFADAIRTGLGTRVIVPIFQYLAVHDKETLYSYLYRTKHVSELDVLLDMESFYLQSLFGGDGIRARSARKHLHPMFLSVINDSTAAAREKNEFMKLAGILKPDKSELMQEWLRMFVEQQGWITKWPKPKADLIAQLLKTEWFGIPAGDDEEDARIRQWLETDSDLIQFDTNTRMLNEGSVRLRFVRPGYRDAVTGQVLARATIRAELSDVQDIADLLDDLKNL